MRKKSTNLDLSVKKKKCNQILKVDRRRKSRTNKKIKTKKNKTLKKGGMKRGRDNNSYLEQKVHKLGRITSAASERETTWVNNVKEAWWEYSRTLIKGLFFLNDDQELTANFSTKIPDDFEEIAFISYKTRHSDKDYIDYIFKIKVESSSPRNDVYLKIFLFVQQVLNGDKGWLELFHITDHPGPSREGSPGAIHVRYLPNIQQIIIQLNSGYSEIQCGNKKLKALNSSDYDKFLSYAQYGLEAITSNSNLPSPYYVKIDKKKIIYRSQPSYDDDNLDLDTANVINRDELLLDNQQRNLLFITLRKYLNRINTGPHGVMKDLGLPTHS